MSAGKVAGLAHRLPCPEVSLPSLPSEDQASSYHGSRDCVTYGAVRGKKLGALGEVMAHWLRSSFRSCGLCSKPQSTGEFPLPTTGLPSLFPEAPKSTIGVLEGVALALNSYFGVHADVSPSEVAKPAREAMKGLLALLERFVSRGECFCDMDWGKYLQVKSVNYEGEEVRTARSFRWENLAPAIPREVGTIPLLDVCEGGTRHYVQEFEKYLVPENEMQFTKPPRVLVSDEDWGDVVSGLVNAGICLILPEHEVCHVDGKPLLNGLFGVNKEEFVDGVEVFRLIMNLVPTNKLCLPVGGDISTLPGLAGMGAYVLSDNEVLLTSSEDIRCFFYLFKIPLEWSRYMCFAKPVPYHLVPPNLQPHTCYIGACVLPMGFLNSVGIAQHVHRNVCRWALAQGSGQLGGEAEIRKDRAFSHSSRCFRIYLDNFDLLSKTDVGLAAKGPLTPPWRSFAKVMLILGCLGIPRSLWSQRYGPKFRGRWLTGRPGMSLLNWENYFNISLWCCCSSNSNVPPRNSFNL